MENKEFNEWCYNNGIQRPQNNSEELDRTMTIEEFYYLLLSCFEAGQNSARKE